MLPACMGCSSRSPPELMYLSRTMLLCLFDLFPVVVVFNLLVVPSLHIIYFCRIYTYLHLR